MLKLITGVVLLLSISCQIKPTKQFDTSEGPKNPNEKLEALMESNPVVLDVRTPFDFNLARMPGAVSIQWQDFSEKNPGRRGYVDKDEFAVARRLALLGVEPEASVLVVGYGPQKGQGEEGRIAWMLHNLGVRNVHTLRAGEVKLQNPRIEPSPKNAPMWIPKNKIQGELDRNLFEIATGHKEPQLKLQTKAGAKARALPKGAGGQIKLEGLYELSLKDLQNQSQLLDVRESFKVEQEPLEKYLKTAKKIYRINWREFYTEQGREDLLGAKAKLEKLGLDVSKPILVYGDSGVESAAAAYVLRKADLPYVFHFAGGINEVRQKKD